MSLPAFATQTITVLRPAWAEDHGTLVADWTTPVTHTVAGCSVQPVLGAEDEINRDAITTAWVIYAPGDADLLDTDRIRLDDSYTYEIVGSVQRWSTGVLDHKVTAIRRVEG